MVIAMMKIIFVDATGMEEIAVDRIEIFSIALIVCAETPTMFRIRHKKVNIIVMQQ